MSEAGLPPRARGALLQASLARFVELTGLSCAAAYELDASDRPVLTAHRGFVAPGARQELETFFGRPSLLGDAARRADGRVASLRATGVDALGVRAVLARAGLAVMTIVPSGGPARPTGAIVLGTPRLAAPAGAGRLGHTERVSLYARLLASLAGLPPLARELVARASALHDAGKLLVPGSILIKSGPLDARERQRVQRRAEHGCAILAGEGTPFAELAARIAWTHHERWDGGGYPRGLAREEIPLEGRIAAIADVFDALTSDRPYRPAMPVPMAIRVMAASAGQHLDPHLLAPFLEAITQRLAPSSRRQARCARRLLVGAAA